MRAPDRKINQKYLNRWYLIPRNRWFNIYLHQFVGSDDDRALHDHPWWSVSVNFRGGKIDEIYQPDPPMGHPRRRKIRKFIPYFRSSTFSHRIVKADSEPSWTIFITGPVIRNWGFWCQSRWVPHDIFNKRGCD